jgi:hypothetical protein
MAIINMTSADRLLTLFLMIAVSCVIAHPSHDNVMNSLQKEKKVILILVDGVRYDYVKDPALKGFQRMARKGVKAEYVQPIFPSNSYPNWYTIVTGMQFGLLSYFLAAYCLLSCASCVSTFILHLHFRRRFSASLFFFDCSHTNTRVKNQDHL